VLAPGGASDLLTAMVGYDAFTQAVTNPLLAPQVFTEDTFTRTGLRIINKTRTLQEILTRNAADPSRSFVRVHLRQGAPLLAAPLLLSHRPAPDRGIRVPHPCSPLWGYVTTFG